MAVALFNGVEVVVSVDQTSVLTCTFFAIRFDHGRFSPSISQFQGLLGPKVKF